MKLLKLVLVFIALLIIGQQHTLALTAAGGAALKAAGAGVNVTKAITAYDIAGNTVMSTQAGVDMVQNGVDAQNALQLLAGIGGTGSINIDAMSDFINNFNGVVGFMDGWSEQDQNNIIAYSVHLVASGISITEPDRAARLWETAQQDAILTGKATINATGKSIVGFVSIGLADTSDMNIIPVTEEDLARGYAIVESAAGVVTEVALTAAGGAALKAAGTGVNVTKAITAYDIAGNTVMSTQAGVDMVENGVDAQNALQLLAGIGGTGTAIYSNKSVLSLSDIETPALQVKGLGAPKSAGHTYDMVNNPGPLATMRGTPALNFAGGKYNSSVLQEDLILYRAGDAGTDLGQWFTRSPASSVAEVRIDLAVKPQWLDEAGSLTGKSPLNTNFGIRIPKGTTIYEGPVGTQGGVHLGGQSVNQIFVPQPWKIPGVEVISRTPLK